MMNPRKIYQQFVAFEEQAAAIYLKMASQLSPENPELSGFWDMGMQEKQHAGLLQFCIGEKLFATDLPSDTQIQQTKALFAALHKRAADPNLSVEDAFKIATQMETSEVNDIYDRLTTPLDASMLRRKLATMLPDHIGHLYKEARKCGVSEETLKELERAVSRQSRQ